MARHDSSKDDSQSVSTNLDTDQTASKIEERRGFAKAGLVTLVSIIAGACDVLNRVGFAGSGNRRTVNSGNANEGDDAEATETPPPDVIDQTQCDEAKKPTDVKNLESPYVPKVKAYGTLDSTLLIVDFFEYDPSMAKKIELFSITHEDGTLVATHFIGGADIKSNGLRHIMVNNIKLKEKFLILVKLDDGSVGKVNFDTVPFETMFRGKAVIARSSNSIDAGFTGNETQAILNIDVPMSGSYPNKLGSGFKFSDAYKTLDGRRLQTVQSTSTFNGPSRLSGFVVTDLMSNDPPLAENGSSFNNFLEHQHVICYKLVGNVYYRTIVSIG